MPRRGPSQLWNPTAFSHIHVRCYSLLSHCCPLLQPSLTVHCYSLLSHCCPLLQPSLTVHCYSLLSQSLATAFSHIAVPCYSLLSQSLATAFSHSPLLQPSLTLLSVSLPQLVTRLLIPALFFLSCTDEHRTVTCHFMGAVTDTVDVRDVKKDGKPEIGGQRGQHRLLPSFRPRASTSSNVDQHQRLSLIHISEPTRR